MLKTLHRTGQILSLFTLNQPEWGISEVARHLGLTTSTTHDLMSSLTQIGLLRQTGQRRYRLGWRTLELSQVVLGSSTLRTETRKAMETFVARYDETVQFGVLDGGMVIYADKIQSRQPIQASIVAQGTRLWAHASAIGKVLLADLPWEAVQAIVAEHGLPTLTPQTIDTLDALHEELDRVRRQKYAYSIEEAVPDLCCVGAAIYDYSGRVVAGVSLSTPAYRFYRHRDEFREAVIRLCNQVSRNLGYLAHLPVAEKNGYLRKLEIR